jgi:Na+/proline symporter/nitrogen-specific signal transduction histidine kinase
MSISIYAIAAVIYIITLFLIAFYTDKKAEQGKSWVNNPYVYALSLAVYCTAWTFYGSVGKAAKSGIGFLPIYFGPTIFAPLWLFVLRKMIVISKAQRITSIADFVSSRYGKSTYLGVLVTVIAFFGIIPYISLQLKAIADSFMTLGRVSNAFDTEGVGFYYNTAFYISMVLALFAILFGTRHADPNERHEGMVNAVAFESLVKLFAFLAVGCFVTFGLYNGFSDLFTKAANHPKIAKLMYVSEGNSAAEWLWLNILSSFAVLFLPRQFHIGVVENTNPNHVTKAMWLFPLYMIGINVFVLPITFAGLMQFDGTSIRPDNFVLELPLAANQPILALLVFIGGLSAAASMVIVETTALSIMLSNHIIMPPLVKTLSRRDNQAANFSVWLLNVRRVSIFLILLLAFFYVHTISSNRELVSIGLVSFTAVAQFTPVILGGMFWKNGTKAGAIAALIVGFFIWAITLSIPTLVEYGLFSKTIITEGYFGLSFLKPYALFGLEGFDQISHAAFWSLTLNVATYFIVSLYTKQSPDEVAQADFFVNISKYQSLGSELDIQRREAKMDDLQFLMTRFLGDDRAQLVFQNFEKEHGYKLERMGKANADLVKYVETQLAGVLGASSAKVLMGTVAKEEPISLDEMLNVLDQTQEIIVTNKMLENKSKELEATTQQLQAANAQLQELDRLKADFITTVTHELRTPMTSIKALSKILLDNQQIPNEQRDEFLRIVVDESERMTRLINQVLDIEKIQANLYKWKNETFNLTDLAHQTFKTFVPTFEEKNIERYVNFHGQSLFIKGDRDKVTQVLVNLLSNAVKFTRTEGGVVALEVYEEKGQVIVKVSDNGRGIPKEKQSLIFERFTQIHDPEMGKPTGSGLGLYISKTIVEHHKGTIGVTSKIGEGTHFWVKLPLSA